METGLQASVLRALGAASGEVDELLAYNENVFDLGSLRPETRFPLPDEPFVDFWQPLADAARTHGAFAVLCEHLPQLSFPIRAGISTTEGYRAATRSGMPVETIPEATGLELDQPEALELLLHASAAGRIPVLIARSRAAFVALIQALTKKNEPWPVPASQGALMVSGYNNWARIRELRRHWEARAATSRETATWSEEFARITPQREPTRTASSSSPTAPTAPCPRPISGRTKRPGRRCRSSSGESTSVLTISPAGCSARCATTFSTS